MRLPATRAAGPALCALLAASCASVPWEGAPSAATWRGRRLHRTATAAIAASDIDAAGETYRELAELVAALAREGIAVPTPVLVIAVSATDPPLLDSALETAARIERWHAAAVGQRTNASDVQIDESDRGLAEEGARSIAGVVPADAFGLPADWAEAAAWAVVVPTPTCLDAVAGRTIDAALERGEVSALQRVLLAPVLASARGQAARELRRQAATRLFEGALAAAARGGRVDAEAAARAADRLGLEQYALPPDAPASKWPDGAGRSRLRAGR